MITATQRINIDLRKYKKKENRRPEKPVNIGHASSNSDSNGSVPKRYQSVFNNGTPLTSFGVENDENYPRTHSPSNPIQPQIHQQPLKPVKEFLTTHPLVNQQLDDHRRSSSHTNDFTRSQTEATVQNVNIALTQTFNKLRQEPSHPTARSTALHAESSPTQPNTPRITPHPNTGTTRKTSSNYYHQLSDDTKSPLPAELTTRRPTNVFASNILPNVASQNRGSTGPGTLIVQRLTATRNALKPNDNTNVRPSTPLRASGKSPETDLDEFNFDNVTLDEPSKKSRTDKNEVNQLNIKSRKQSPSPHVHNQHQALPEVSVNPQIQSIVRQNTDHFPYIHQSIINGETYTNHHHIQVEPTNTSKPISPSIKSQQIIDVQPNLIIQHQRASSPTKYPLNEAYIDRDNTRRQVAAIENTYANNDSTLKPKQEPINHSPALLAPPPSPLNHLQKKERNKNSIGTALVTRKNTKYHRPSSRIENYDDDSDSELTITETQSREDDMAQRHNPLPSDILTDAWSDLASEFSDTKLRKNPNIRTSTPNITRHSSSLSSKEVIQMRKQLNNLQMMYDDLLKIFENDIESLRSSVKSNTSSPTEHNGPKRRFRKVVPVMSKRQSNLEMKEINQRFATIESSIVTLAESIAKLSAQVQMQRVMKDDVYHLRQEVAELRQQLSHQQSLAPATAAQQPSRLITANVQRLAGVNNTNPLNISTSYIPSTSIIDPRQARKIEQFFGTEAMLSYFLSLLNYQDYAAILEQEKIGFYQLPFLDERKLQSFGIPYGPCVRIIHESQQYFISLLLLKSNGIHV